MQKWFSTCLGIFPGLSQVFFGRRWQMPINTRLQRTSCLVMWSFMTFGNADLPSSQHWPCKLKLAHSCEEMSLAVSNRVEGAVWISDACWKRETWSVIVGVYVCVFSSHRLAFLWLELMCLATQNSPRGIKDSGSLTQPQRLFLVHQTAQNSSRCSFFIYENVFQLQLRLFLASQLSPNSRRSTMTVSRQPSKSVFKMTRRISFSVPSFDFSRLQDPVCLPCCYLTVMDFMFSLGRYMMDYRRLLASLISF